MELGVFVTLTTEVEKEIKKVHDLGLTTCQIGCWRRELFTDDIADAINAATKKYNITITALWCGWEAGPCIWDFYEGPQTLGLVPLEYRFDRLVSLKAGSDFAKKIGVTDVATHVGFIPEYPNTTEYKSLVVTIKYICKYLKENGQYFLFETGQETPVTLKRMIEDTGMDNVGINLDPANLILYGKANPVDALDIFGEYVRGIHGKDGNYPTNGHDLGEEKPIGEGKVNFPLFVARLKEIGYDGAITIEREIEGDQQIADIKKSIELFKEWLV